MSKTRALLGRLLPCCGSEASDPQSTQALLDKDNVAVLSAACCDATAGLKDEQLKANLLQAMTNLGDSRPVVVETITSAQQHMWQLQAQSDERQKQLISTVVSLFQANGMSVFPMLIVNGRVAFYGGVPSVTMIEAKLRSQPLSALSL